MNRVERTNKRRQDKKRRRKRRKNKSRNQPSSEVVQVQKEKPETATATEPKANEGKKRRAGLVTGSIVAVVGAALFLAVHYQLIQF